MKARLIVEHPQDVEFTAKITMPLKQWSDLRDQLAEKWPSSDLSRVITDMVIQAQRQFYASEEQTATQSGTPDKNISFSIRDGIAWIDPT